MDNQVSSSTSASDLYFYFSTLERKLRYRDNREIKVGETHRVNGPVELCEYGLHASKRIIDALQYAPGPILHLVTLGGEVVHGDDKSVATERTYVASFDATEVLREFARKQALINIELIKPYCKSEEYEVIVEYLKSGREDLRVAAWTAAEAAAWTAVGYAAEAAAWTAAGSAAKYAAEAAVGSAVGSAAKYAAWTAAWTAAKYAAKTAVGSAVGSAARSAARSAAEAAAWSAAWSAAWYAARSAAEAAAWTAAWTAANEMLLQSIKDATGWEV